MAFTPDAALRTPRVLLEQRSAVSVALLHDDHDQTGERSACVPNRNDLNNDGVRDGKIPGGARHAPACATASRMWMSRNFMRDRCDRATA